MNKVIIIKKLLLLLLLLLLSSLIFYLKVLGLSIPILKSRLYSELLERPFAIQRWDSMLPLVSSNQVLLVLIRVRL